MKRSFVACLAGAFLIALPALAHGQISASAHNFAAETWNPSGEICVVCHAPHNNTVTLANAPLWNHDTTSATFTVYTSPTLDAGPLGQPAGISKLCLSCHDGTVALDSYGGATGTNFITNANGDSLGVDLGNDHPISFAYTAGLDPELYDPTTQSSGLGGTIDADMLFSTQLECASCHDVHNGAGLANLLRKSNAVSALCLTCHNK